MKIRSLRSFAVLLTVSSLICGLLVCSSGSDKIPVTTSSEEALKLYLQGRDLWEKLRHHEAYEYLEKAIAIDPSFALAYNDFGYCQPTAKGYFAMVEKAVSLSENVNVSEGERLIILGHQAAIHADPARQKEYYLRLVELYPKDEWAHNILGGHYFSQRQYAEAVEQYKEAIRINDKFTSPYNQLGYAYRFLGEYEKAEKAFRKYIELIPDNPNPYDSYAELLMKMGNYGESIESYHKALELDPNFTASHMGIACNLNFLGKHKDARDQLEEFFDVALDDRQRREALYAMAISYVDEGKPGEALKQLERQYRIAERADDPARMAEDLNTMGYVLIDDENYEAAKAKFEAAIKLTEESNLAKEIKENYRRVSINNLARVAVKMQDFAAARVDLAEYRKRAESMNNPRLIAEAHELAGIIALEEKQYDQALEELAQASQYEPGNIYRTALAYLGKGDKDKAGEWLEKLVKYNALNDLSYALYRGRGKELLESL
ncbi:MAG: tetratricopeptide repeat protein [Candidatus Zixiibacteriota bacterium]|nr:MAG: tetratricopeptide repeat protein [candidate division Zixibacteria bacterium]